jgi:sirohydrochlorin ferrochelatase
MVDRQRPTEVAFWSPTTPKLQAAADRLSQRGVSEIVVVPLFTAAPLSDLASHVKSQVPLRVMPILNGNPVVGEIVLSRAQEISRNPAAEVLLLVSHRATAGDERWVPDLRATALHLNRTHTFAAIMSTTVSPDGAEASAKDAAALRSLLERQTGMGRRILVVPVLTPYGGAELAIKDQLQGLSYDVAKSAVMPDDRVVAWIVSHADVK